MTGQSNARGSVFQVSLLMEMDASIPGFVQKAYLLNGADTCVSSELAGA